MDLQGKKADMAALDQEILKMRRASCDRAFKTLSRNEYLETKKRKLYVPPIGTYHPTYQVVDPKPYKFIPYEQTTKSEINEGQMRKAKLGMEQVKICP